ncbi:MAG: SDR family oxidoreductase [Candidatus Ranarchaeia archaeon]
MKSKFANKMKGKNIFIAELIDRGIRVNVLSPGTIDTPVFGKMGDPLDEANKAKEQFTSLIPLKRIGTAKEMGEIGVFLASSDSSFVVGEEIIADGGVMNL